MSLLKYVVNKDGKTVRNPRHLAYAGVRAARTPQDQLDEHADAIRKLGKRAFDDMVAIGRHLTEAKALAGHGNWLPWLEREFGWHQTTATRFMEAHEAVKSGKLSKLLDSKFLISPSALCMLAKPSTPPTAVDEILERAERGERVNTAEVEKIGPIRPSPPPPVEVSFITEVGPKAPQQSVTVVVKPHSGRPLIEQPPPVIFRAKELLSALHSIETSIANDQLDEAAEYLISTNQADRAMFKKIGAALSYVGNTVQGNPTKTAASATADKYFKSGKPH